MDFSRAFCTSNPEHRVFTVQSRSVEIFSVDTDGNDWNYQESLETEIESVECECGSDVVELPDHVSNGTIADVKFNWSVIEWQTQKNGCFEFQSEDNVWFKFVRGERVVPVDFNK